MENVLPPRHVATFMVPPSDVRSFDDAVGALDDGRRHCDPPVTPSCRGPRYVWFDSTSVPAAESMPPMPFTSPSFTFGTWRGPHSPRSCRTDSMMGKIPYMPLCVYESPPPFVLIGSLPPG